MASIDTKQIKRIETGSVNQKVLPCPSLLLFRHKCITLNLSPNSRLGNNG